MATIYIARENVEDADYDVFSKPPKMTKKGKYYTSAVDDIEYEMCCHEFERVTGITLQPGAFAKFTLTKAK